MSYRPSYPKAYSMYGASMGRRSDELIPGRIHLSKVKLDSGGYDPGGAYWGSGPPALWVAEDEEGNVMYFRAYDRAAAKLHVLKSCPGCRFFR